ncbi:HypC/HybG/HupF family hydrogenase formation chaperone [Escherichia coli]|nr:HypC/HybG/HupF family hydrogenase formation chaperone [Escherichia coli]
MCLAVPGEVLKISDCRGVVKVGNLKREVFMHLVPEVKIGQYVLIHAGCAIEIIDEKAAKETLEILRKLSDN